MKILVTVKRVTDYETKLKVRPDGTNIETDGVNMIANPFDEIAVEEALRLKEKHGGEIVVVSIGQSEASQQIRSAMAMGADRGILITSDINLDSAAVARVLQKVVTEEAPDVVLMGKQAIDDDSHQVSESLAELLSWGQATQANTINIQDRLATVVREADGGLETVEVDLPCIITTDLRLNEPRYASLPGIMKAKRKPLLEKSAQDYGVDLAPWLTLKQVELPPSKSGGEIVPDVSTLVKKLSEEAKVL